VLELKTLYEYFEEAWNHEPHPVIDHSLRVERRGDKFLFYIHPANTGGDTRFFVVDVEQTRPFLSGEFGITFPSES
jgi:hypothetical protein